MNKQIIRTQTKELLSNIECSVYYSENAFEKFYKECKKKFSTSVQIANAIFDKIILTSNPLPYEN